MNGRVPSDEARVPSGPLDLMETIDLSRSVFKSDRWWRTPNSAFGTFPVLTPAQVFWTTGGHARVRAHLEALADGVFI